MHFWFKIKKIGRISLELELTTEQLDAKNMLFKAEFGKEVKLSISHSPLVFFLGTQSCTCPPIRMSHWCHTMVDGAKFWISCQRLRVLRIASRWQLIQNLAPSTIVWRQCDSRIKRWVYEVKHFNFASLPNSALPGII